MLFKEVDLDNRVQPVDGPHEKLDAGGGTHGRNGIGADSTWVLEGRKETLDLVRIEFRGRGIVRSDLLQKREDQVLSIGTGQGLIGLLEVQVT